MLFVHFECDPSTPCLAIITSVFDTYLLSFTLEDNVDIEVVKISFCYRKATIKK